MAGENTGESAEPGQLAIKDKGVVGVHLHRVANAILPRV
jgi:hypothetical protein